MQDHQVWGQIIYLQILNLSFWTSTILHIFAWQANAGVITFDNDELSSFGNILSVLTCTTCVSP